MAKMGNVDQVARASELAQREDLVVLATALCMALIKAEKIAEALAAQGIVERLIVADHHEN